MVRILSAKKPAEQVVKDVRRVTRRYSLAEDKVRVALGGRRGDEVRDLRRVASALKECVADPTLENRLLK
jgi:transposase